jgi:uracil-DNA glycosylase
MRDEPVRQLRRAMLHEPHIAPLTAYAARLREGGSIEVPDFDPFDGGIHAQVLFLFEKPGPMTASNSGSGFISRNNDDPSAEATFAFMQRAGIPRKLTVTWNVIPWWNGTRKVTKKELRDGVDSVRELIALLPLLRAAVLVGRNAAKAIPYLRSGTALALFTSAHPSPLVRAKYPERWNAISSQWAEVRKVLAIRAER